MATYKQLEAFNMVAQTGNFAVASEQLNVSQPALSMAIKKLEESLGGELFSRSTRRVILTPEGEALLTRSKRLLQDWDQSLSAVTDLFNLRRGSLSIAAMPTFASGELPILLKKFIERYSDVDINVQDVIAEQVIEALHSGRAELGVSFEPQQLNGLSFTPLIDDRFVALMPKGHDLADLPKIEWRQLIEYPHIALHRPSSVRILTDKMLSAHNLALAPSVEAHQLSSIGPMIQAGIGISPVPGLTAKQFDNECFVCRPLVQPTITRRVGLLHKSDKPLSSAATAMVKIIKGAFGNA